MIRISGNKLGFGMIIASAVVAGLGSAVFKLPDATVMITVGIALIVMDLLMRMRLRPTAGWLTQKQYGGYIYIVPIWMVGVIVIAANVMNQVFGPFTT